MTALTTPERDCRGCTLCCEVPPIVAPDVRKSANTPCVNCVSGEGCRIYETRYAVCQAFTCGWRGDAGIAAHWRPIDSRMVLAPDPQSASLVVHVAAATPLAWRADPYLTDLRAWAAAGLRVVVKNGESHTIIFPNGEKRLGAMPPGHALLVHKTGTMFWAVYDAEFVPSSDPRARGAVGKPSVAFPDALNLDGAFGRPPEMIF